MKKIDFRLEEESKAGKFFILVEYDSEGNRFESYT